jgi:hypothetical protein
LEGLEMENLIAIWNILRPLGIFNRHLVHYITIRKFSSNLVYFLPDSVSGNPDPCSNVASDENRSRLERFF